MASRDEAWEKVLNETNALTEIQKNKFIDLSATTIKKISKKEPRLMCKVDFKNQLPAIFKTNKLSILAIENGLYRIGNFNAFFDLPDIEKTPIIEIDPPTNLVTLDPFNIKSESQALDIFKVTSMGQKIFKTNAELTIRGRKRNEEPLKFGLSNIAFEINGVQIEVDGGYETDKEIFLFEAKLDTSKDMNFRQTLYPYLMWKDILKGKKAIRNWVLMYQEPVFNLIEVEFDCNQLHTYANFSDIVRFKFKEASPTLPAFTPYTPQDIPPKGSSLNNSVPFPQADSIQRLIHIFKQIHFEDYTTKDELFMENSIDMRQISYYTDALLWLGYIEKIDGTFMTTRAGEEFAELSFPQKKERLSRRIFEDEIFNLAYKTNYTLTPELKELFSRQNINSESTMNRRLQTVKAWIGFLLD